MASLKSLAQSGSFYARKDDLFRLIKSLNRAEKRYCRIQASSTAKDSRYLKLFDALDALEKYEERTFLQGRKGKAFQQNFSYTKNYLFNHILKSLTVYHAEHDASARLRELLQQIAILYHKRLFEAARGRIKRGLELTVKCDLPAYKYLLLQWELRIQKTASQTGESFEDRLSLYREMLKALEEAKGFEAYRKITDKMVFNMRRTGQFREPVDIMPLQQLLDDPLLSNPDLATSPEQKVSFYFSHATFANCMGDMKAAESHLDQVLYWINQMPDRNDDRLEEYVMRSNNFFIAWHRTGAWTKSEALLDRLSRIKVDSRTVNAEAVKSHLWRVLHFNKLELYWKTGRFIDAVALVPIIEDGLQNHHRYMTATNRCMFYFILACHYFGLSQFEEALNWLNRYFSEEQNCMRVDKHAHARLFALIVHFELNHREALPYFALSTYKYLQRQKMLFGLEKLVIHYLKNRFLRAPDKTTVHAAFADLLIDFEKLLEDPLERNALRYFDFMAWLRSHVEKRSFVDVMAERAIQHVGG